MTGFSNRTEIILIILLEIASSLCVDGILMFVSSKQKEDEAIVFDAETEALGNEISDAIEQMELFIEQLIDTDVGSILHINEVAHHHIVALAVSMAATYALLYTLGVPR